MVLLTDIFAIPIQLVILDFISIAAALGVGYYAAKIFYHLRQGRLEKGWTLMLYGSALIACGYFFLTVEDLFLAYAFFSEIEDYIGTIVCTIGLIVLMFGLRSHYSAWSLSRSAVSESKKRERDSHVDAR